MSTVSKDRLHTISISEEVKTSYLNYAMSVIVSRALPDVRDGLKPVHRRILYAMYEMGLHHDRPYKKAGRIVGDVLGKYHPHGDQSIYDALVRMAQNFSLRYPLVRGQGNFGSVDGDPPAAMRYTEAKMMKISEALLAEITKETVDFAPNYDDSLEEPRVLPAALPFLLLNGSSGIAVGMATNIPPHNLTEVRQALLHLLENPQASVMDMMRFIKGPDFPTAGIIHGQRGIYDAYTTGKGQITVRSRHHLEVDKESERVRLIFTEIPYMLNKSELLSRTAELVREKRIEGISDIRDESNREGIRILIELRPGVEPDILLKKLYQYTDFQKNFNINSVALVDGRPQVLTLMDFLQHFLNFRREVLLRRISFELRKAQERAHILEGLQIALDHLDEVIRLIRSSQTVQEASLSLQNAFSLTQIQAQAILDMRLQKLTNLESAKIVEELNKVLAFIQECQELLASEERIIERIKEELIEASADFEDERKTQIVTEEVGTVVMSDLIQKAQVVVVVSSDGYIKRVPLSDYRLQGRGGKGASSAALKDDESISLAQVCSTHDHLLLITSHGQAYSIRAYDLPEESKSSKGAHLRQFIPGLSDKENLVALAHFVDFDSKHALLMATKLGQIVRISLEEFRNARSRGVKAIDLATGDTVISATVAGTSGSIFCVTRHGYGMRFKVEEVRQTSRGTKGVRSMRLREGDRLASVVFISGKELLLLSKKAYGKRVLVENVSTLKRGASGVVCYKPDTKTGPVLGALSLGEKDSFMCLTSDGKAIRTMAENVSLLGRTAKGVKVLNLSENDHLVGMTLSNDL